MSKDPIQFGRLFSGKYGTYKNLKIEGIKKEGSEVGAFFTCSQTNPDKQDGQINFLGKFINKPVEEKIYMDIVRYFSNGPSTRLAHLTEDAVKKCARQSVAYAWMQPEEFEEEVWMGGLKDSYPKVKNGEYLAYLSKLVPGYRNLEDYQVNDLNGKIKFKDYIEKYHSFPSTLIIDNQEYPFIGIMKNAAVALFVGDKDWLGGSCKNTGAYIKNINGIDYAVAIHIDVGFAVDPHIEPFKISKNVIPCNANYSSSDESKNSIHINKLAPEKYNEFLQALYLIVHRYPEGDRRMDGLLEEIVKRNGAFNDSSFEDELLTDETSIEIVNKLKSRIKELKETFSEALEEYAYHNAIFLDALIAQEQEKDSKFLADMQKIHVQINEEAINLIKPGQSTWPYFFNSINWAHFGIGAASLGTIIAFKALSQNLTPNKG